MIFFFLDLTGIKLYCKPPNRFQVVLLLLNYLCLLPHLLSSVFHDCNATLFGQKPWMRGFSLGILFFFFWTHLKAWVYLISKLGLWWRQNHIWMMLMFMPLLLTLSTEFARTALQIKQLGKHFSTSSEKSETENCLWCQQPEVWRKHVLFLSSSHLVLITGEGPPNPEGFQSCKDHISVWMLPALNVTLFGIR